MQRSKKILIVPLVVLSVTVAAFLTTQLYNNHIKLLSKINNSFYNDNAVYFYQTGENLRTSELYQRLSDGMLLYNQISSEQDVRGVLFKGNIEYPQLIRGDFFDEEVFCRSQKLAVIGCEVETIEIDGDQYYEFNGDKYRVVGIMGYDMKTRLDRTVFLSMNDDILFSNVQYIASSKDQERVMSLLGDRSLFGDVMVMPRENPGLLYVTSTGKNVDITTNMFILSLLFHSFVLMYFVVDGLRDEMVIMKMNGLSKRCIFKHFWSKFSCLAAMAVLLGTAGATVVACIRKNFSLSSVLIGDGIVFLFFQIIICYSVVNSISQIKDIKAGGLD